MRHGPVTGNRYSPPLLGLSLVGSCSGEATPSGPPSPSTGGTVRAITRADDGEMVTLAVGDQRRLALDQGFRWTVRWRPIGPRPQRPQQDAGRRPAGRGGVPSATAGGRHPDGLRRSAVPAGAAALRASVAVLPPRDRRAVTAKVARRAVGMTRAHRYHRGRRAMKLARSGSRSKTPEGLMASTDQR